MAENRLQGALIEKEFQEWVKPRGGVHEIRRPYLLVSNGAMKRLNCTILDMVRAMILGMELQHKDIWTEAIHIVSFLPNGLLTKSSGEPRRR